MSEPTSEPTSQPTSAPAPKRRRAKAAAPAPVVEAPAPAPAAPPAPAPVAAEPSAEPPAPTAKPGRKSSKKAAPAAEPAPAPAPEPAPAVELAPAPAPEPPAEPAPEPAPVPAIPVVVEVLAAPAPAAVIDRLYHELMALTRQADLLLAVGVGRLLIDRLYGGDFSSWRTRARKDDASLRALAARFKAADVLGFSATNLYRAIAVTELVEKLGGLPGVERRRLGLGHYRAVLGVEGAQQVKLLDRAEAKGWSAERLAAEVARLRKKKGERRGRPPLPGFVKTLNHLQRILEDEDDAFADLDAVDALDAAEATRLYDAATAMKEKCEALQAALRGKARGDG